MKYYIRLVRHSFKVAYYSLLIGLSLEMPFKLMLSIVIAAFFHDIGKFKLDFNVLYNGLSTVN